MKSRNVFIVGPEKLEVREVNVPDPANDQVQVRCVVNGICTFETSVYRGVEKGWYPCAAGHEGVGVVTKVGREVTGIKEGTWVSCRSWATYQNLAARDIAVFTKAPPDPKTFITEPPCCAVTAVHSYCIVPGDSVLVLGAGYMGLLNVQLLAHCPISELVVSDIKQKNLALARDFGATEVIDSSSSAGRQRLEELEKQGFDLVVEAAGVAETLTTAGNLTRPGGRLATFAWHHGERPVNMSQWHLKGITVLNASPIISINGNIQPMQRTARLLERGIFDQRSLISHTFTIDQIQQAMDFASSRPPDYCKGVLLFE